MRCTQNEYNTIVPPPGQTCAQYLGDFVSALNGPDLGTGYYVDGPNGTCDYCQFRVGNDYLNTILLNAAYRFRDIGIICAYITFNIMLSFALFYLFRIFKLSNLKKSKSSKKGASTKQAELEQEKTTTGAVASEVDAGAEKATEAINSTSAAATGPGHHHTEPMPTLAPFGGAAQAPVQDTEARV